MSNVYGSMWNHDSFGASAFVESWELWCSSGLQYSSQNLEFVHLVSLHFHYSFSLSVPHHFFFHRFFSHVSIFSARNGPCQPFAGKPATSGETSTHGESTPWSQGLGISIIWLVVEDNGKALVLYDHDLTRYRKMLVNQARHVFT